MEYENLSYSRMLQVLNTGRVARMALAANGQPYVVPLCYTCRMDGCIPVLELKAHSEGRLLAALAANPNVMLEIERTVHGATECVLLQGQALVEQPVAPPAPGQCSACRLGADHPAAMGAAYGAPQYTAPQPPQRRAWGEWNEDAPTAALYGIQNADRPTERVRFDGADINSMPPSCSTCRNRPANRNGQCAACQNGFAQHAPCSCQAGSPAPQPAQPDHTLIRVAAIEMTGRCYRHCQTGCDPQGY